MIASILIRLILLILAHLITVPTYVVWMVILYPIRILNADLYWKLDMLLMKGVHVVVAYWIHASGYHVVEVGDELSDCVRDTAVVIANHQSTADVPALMVVLGHQDRGMLAGRLCWVMEYIFKFTQFGLLCRLHGDFFIVQGRETRHLQPKLLSEHLKRVFIPRKRQWVLLFPEGGFLRKRRQASKEYGRKNGYPILENVTLPRLGALESIINTLGENNCENGNQLKWLIDATIMYPEGKPLDLPRMFFGLNKKCNIYVHYRKYPISSIPTDNEELTKWLYARYEEKDKMLADYYSTGSVSNGSKSVPQRPLDITHTYALSIYLSFLISTLLHVYLFMNTVNSACNLLSVFS